MTRPRQRIGAELLPVLLVLVCLGGSLALVVTAYRRQATLRKAPQPPPTVLVPPVPKVEPAAPPVPPPAEDPTPAVLARLAASAAEHMKATADADRKAEELGRAQRAAEQESRRWRRREVLVRAQLDSLEAQAQQIETDAEMLALEHDVLARERDDVKSSLMKARARAGSFAILPYKGPTGTWQRPIALECHDGSVTIQPKGSTFGLVDISSVTSFRSNPFIAAVAREMIRAQGTPTPDGEPCVPYLLFVIRPDGVRAYYEARARLEPLGITFGYELVEQDWEIDFPDLDDPAEWKDASPARTTGDVAARWPERKSQGGSGTSGNMVWPTSPPGGPRYVEAEQPPPLQRALEGPPNRRLPGGSPDDGSRPGSIPANVLPLSARPPELPNGRVEIVPRGPSGRRVVAALPPSRWATAEGDPTDTAPGGAGGPDSSGRETSRSSTSLPGRPASAGGGPDRSLASLLERSAHTGDGQDGSVQDLVRGSPPQGGGQDGSLRDQRPTDGRPENAGLSGATAPRGPSMAGAPRSATRRQDSSQVSGSPNGDPRSTTGTGVPVPTHGSQGSSDLGEGPPPPRSHDEHHMPEQVLEMVVICGPREVEIRPGDQKLSLSTMQSDHESLLRQLRSIVHGRRKAEPLVYWHPRILCLVQPGGEVTYREVRKQTILANTGWPVSLHVAESTAIRPFEKELR